MICEHLHYFFAFYSAADTTCSAFSGLCRSNYNKSHDASTSTYVCHISALRTIIAKKVFNIYRQSISSHASHIVKEHLFSAARHPAFYSQQIQRKTRAKEAIELAAKVK